MKPETEKGLRNASIEVQQEVVRLLCEIMQPADFVAGLVDASEEVTRDGTLVYQELDSYFQDDPSISDDQSASLYDAICEGRRDDAIEILAEITGERFRSIREQRNLFPDRVPA